VPLSAQDFTPFAQQIKQQKTDLLFVAWAGTTAPAMWRALEQQNVFGSVDKVVTGLAERATYPTFGPVASKISFLSHYVSNAPKNKVNDFLVKSMRKRGQVPDLFTPDGFVAGQMIVHALSKGSVDSVDRMISALEGWSFTGPKGQQTIRASDHAMLQPMFQVKLVQNGDTYRTTVIKSLRAKYTAPPEKK
jgi:branched-chain amino acid transport system substrate-binding protein